ncbi:CHAP domain-containing protein [Tabrizicola sp. SY72]|nr:CHAP domain-containing protein [Tabrizicola sp. SY72]
MSRKERRALAAAEAAAEADRAALKEVVAEVASAPKKGRIWCVPFARAVSGIEIKGNAATWWKQAADLYARGNEPKVGAVLNFRASRAMPMGHVAVVSAVVSDREVLVDQANWERNRITEDTLVVDVSAKNDWSEVRVANANGTLGRTNPVYGFIYR